MPSRSIVALAAACEAFDALEKMGAPAAEELALSRVGLRAKLVRFGMAEAPSSEKPQ